MSQSPLWTLNELRAVKDMAEVHGITPNIAHTNVEFHGISIDSRTVAEGDLFIAIKGVTHDGHDFVEAAIRAGANAALVSREKAASLQALDLPLIIVPDPADGLDALAVSARARTSAKIVAVTGSVGKTSTRAYICQALESSGKTHASIRSYNNRWGVSLSLARMPRDSQFGVFELGMNHPGEIALLARRVRPHVAVITHVSEAHLEFFASVEAIAVAKAEIFEGLEPGGVAVLGADHPHLALLTEIAMKSGASRVISYGLAAGSDVRTDPVAGAVRVGADEIALRLNQLGTHHLVNAAGALAVAEALGVPPPAAAAALEMVESEPGRGVIHHLAKGITLIDESYNANPASMRAALAVLRDWPTGGRKIAVLGDMLELGAASPKLHAAMADSVASSGTEMVFLAGEMMRNLGAELPRGMVAARTATAAELTEKLLKSLASGDVVMVKGSNGVRLSGLVAAVIERFGRPPAGASEGR
ncbi:MAG: UDP-N-acetylmuramoyl-tripeptide--D-alanyl-D-alanine ligase [Cucumibacter sp.]